MRLNYILMLLLFCYGNLSAQVLRTGRTVDRNGEPIVGASIFIVPLKQSLVSGKDGKFTLPSNFGGGELSVSHVGFEHKVIYITSGNEKFEIVMLVRETSLQEVSVSTGYQTLSKERATGSFAQVGNELLNRRVGTDIISRIEDVASGVVFNRAGEGNDPISIRGRNTIFANARPLIVIDNFPYDGDLININPNDIESVTILKDAAASSIWGARAGNGVIVLTTKKGKLNSDALVSFNSNFTIGEKPDQYYRPRMSSADFIEVEKMLFAKGFYQSSENAINKPPLTPVVELLIAQRDGKMDATEVNRRLEELKGYDVRKDFDHYLHRNSVAKQFSLGIQGGGELQKYNVSVGHDYNLSNLAGNKYARTTIGANHTYLLANQKLQLSTGVFATFGNSDNNNVGGGGIVLKSGFLYPYARLADDNGNPLAIVKNYRQAFADQAATSGLLNWDYKPLEEIALSDNSSTTKDYRFNVQANYRLFEFLTFDVLYQFTHNTNIVENLRSEKTYFTRDLINYFSQVSPTGVNYILPMGGILDRANAEMNSHNLRAQINFTKRWNKHEVNAILGAEQRNVDTENGLSRLYGYDHEHRLSRMVDYVDLYPQYYSNTATARIPYVNSENAYSDRFRSYYMNGSYSYNSRYMLSISARVDQSNLFGVRTNQKSVPLWSVGLGWNLNEEEFYHLNWLPLLKLRATYGASGNIDKTVSAFSTATYLNNALSTGLPYAQIRTAGNPDLKWEQIHTLNLGLDFSSKGQRISGSFDWYQKKGTDIIGNISFAPSTGIATFKGNFANTTVKGFDMVINSRNLEGRLSWNTNFLLSMANEKVTGYYQDAPGLNYLSLEGVPAMGNPLFAIYSLDWGGLDPSDGSPIGYLNGEKSQNYASIISSANLSNLNYHGSLRPTVFGSVRNTISYRNISFSFNVTYRLGYFLRMPSVAYNPILSGTGGHADYALRWQKQGDEAFTQIPSMPATANSSKDNVYTYSEILVRKGDHIRLQDINLSYALENKLLKKIFLKRLEFFMYCNNLGILWKSTSGNFDPDYVTTVPPARTLAFGLRGNF